MAYFLFIEILMIAGAVWFYRNWHLRGRSREEKLGVIIATIVMLIIGNGIEISLKDGDVHRIWLGTAGFLLWCALVHFISRFELERQLARMPSLNPNPVMRLSSDSLRVAYANKSSQIFTDRGELKSEIFEQIKGHVDLAEKNGTSIAGEVLCGQEVFSAHFVPTGADGVLMYCQNITQLVAMRYSLNAERLKSSSVDTMAALGEATAGICHDINNPLSVVTGQAHSMRRRYTVGTPVDERFAKGIGEIWNAAERITKITQTALKLVRHGESDRQVCNDIPSLLAEVVDLCQHRAAKGGVKVELIDIPIDAQVAIAETNLLRVIMNLVSNGIDAVNGREGAWVRVRAVAGAQRFSIRIADSGGGIPEHLRAQMFQPLFTTKPMGKGTGLGLTLCKRLVTEAGGDIYINLESPHTEFVVDIPYASQT